MDVLVTGGSGAIGEFVVDELEERGHDVTVFDVVSPDTGTAFIKGDITDRAPVERAVEGSDIVVHLAAMLVAAEQNPPAAEQVNVGGLLHVLEAAAANDVRVVFASSKAVFGPMTGTYADPMYEPLGEEAPKNPLSVYGMTKWTGEQFCRTYERQFGVRSAIVRFGSTYGPGKGENHGNLSLITDLVERAADGQEITIAGGDQRNDFIYYRDIARGIAALIEADSWSYRTYHLGAGSLFTLHDFADALRDHCPDSTIQVDGGMDFYGGEYLVYCRMDISRARSDLDFTPAFPPSKAIPDFLDHIQS